MVYKLLNCLRIYGRHGALATCKGKKMKTSVLITAILVLISTKAKAEPHEICPALATKVAVDFYNVNNIADSNPDDYLDMGYKVYYKLGEVVSRKISNFSKENDYISYTLTLRVEGNMNPEVAPPPAKTIVIPVYPRTYELEIFSSDIGFCRINSIKGVALQ